MENVIVPKTKTPDNVTQYHLWVTMVLPMCAISVILLLIKLIFSTKFNVEIPIIFIFLSIPIWMLILGKKKSLLNNLYEFVPPYFALPMINESTSKIRILFGGLNKISGNEQAELKNGEKHFLDLKRVIAKNNTSTFETSSGGSAQCEWLLALNCIITSDYDTTAENVIRFNSKHSEAVFEEINAKMMNRISSFYSGNEFENKNTSGIKIKGEGLVYESWVQDQIFGNSGTSSTYKKNLEKQYGVHIGVAIFNSNPVQEILDARNKISKAKAFDESLNIIAKGLKDQGIDASRADYLTKLVFGLTTETNENFNVSITGLENAQNISIVGMPTKGGSK